MANPDPKTDHLKPNQFKPGQSGNPGGLTAGQRKRISDNADKAAKLQEMALDALMDTVIDPETGEKVDGAGLSVIAADPQRFLKEVIDRGFGQASQKLDLSSEDGTMTPSVITRRVVDPQADGA